MSDVERLYDWLVEGAPGATGPNLVVERVAGDLVAAGVPIDRAEAFVRTLHPHVVGRSFLWRPGQPVEITERSYSFLHSDEFRRSPAAEVFRTGEPVRLRLTDGAHSSRMASELRAEGYRDFFVGPMRFLSGQVHALTVATRRPDGFSDEHLGAVLRVLSPLSRIAEIMALARTATNLLDAYVGHNAGERILAGNIRRGDSDQLHAVLWFSDLRDFTSMSTELPPGQVIAVLNELFDCQVPAIERHGGEVLKFMGDGLLAIFPFGATARTDAELADAALDAAGEAFAALAAVNARRTGPPIRFGLALHVGDVAYGNIGGSGRLDFTCIGPAVNLAARLEGVASRLGRQLVTSTEFARLTSRPVEELGSFELKGVPGLVSAWAPALTGSAGTS
jgi:adenylate cyclase